ncbi:MAG: hypothetical protein AAF348_19265 [Bacteroidota bacterium]
MKKVAVLVLLFASCSDFSEKFSNNITLVHEGEFYNFVTKKNHPGLFLEANVVEVKENKKYIFFYQIIHLERLRRDLAADIYPNERYLDSIPFGEKADSIIANSNHLRKQVKFEKAYFVLIKSKDSLLGPFKEKSSVVKYGF